jgi:hypothetical protein
MTLSLPPNRVERWLGRSLALCAHPFTAWRLSSRRTRAGIVAGYAAAGYVTMLAGLLFLG